MSDQEGLLHAYVLDGAGGACRVEWPEIRAWQSGSGTLWVHVDRGGALIQQWLAQESGLEPLIVRALIAEETRPRSALTPSGLLVIAPQRDAIVSLCGTHTALLGDPERMRLRECADRVTRYVEDLDTLRDRAAVTNDELHARLAEMMNRRMYLLSLVAAVFLPLGLITGLLGVNVGGIPGRDSELGFWLVSALLVMLGGAAVWLLRRRRLF